jgi:hypothetical protein
MYTEEHSAFSVGKCRGGYDGLGIWERVRHRLVENGHLNVREGDVRIILKWNLRE